MTPPTRGSPGRDPVRVMRTGRRVAATRPVRRAGLAGAVLVALLLNTTGTQDAVANGDTRTLRLYHNHTRESLTVTFRRNGQYDPRALEQLNWFLRDWRLDEPTQMDPRLFDTLWEVHREVGSDEAIHVNSAYRSPRTNAMLRRRSSAVAKNSQHMRGKAMDFYLPDVPIERIRAVGMRLQDGGVGYYPSAYTPFVHLDVGSVRSWPRMTRSQLARIFPDGKTVHIPADGEPMARYEEARAEVLAKGGAVGGYTAVAEGEGAAAAPRTRSFWARLFGIGEEDEDAEEISTARNRQVYVPRRAPPPAVTGDPDSVYAALRQHIAPAEREQPVRLAARPAPLPEPDPQTRVEVAAALRRPIDEPKPALPPTRIAGLPATVETPAGPRLTWQQGPAGQSAPGGSLLRELALAPMPPRRPDDVVETGALAFAPIPPVRPGSAAPAALSAAATDLQIAGAAVATLGIAHPLPPRRPDAAEARPIAVAAADPAALSLRAVTVPQAGPGRDDRAQLRDLLAAPAPTARATPAAAAEPAARPVPGAPKSLLTDPSATAALGFSARPAGDLAPNRFTGQALRPAAVVR
jgi:uncharacterized protein YcbK (DUF882 family)